MKRPAGYTGLAVCAAGFGVLLSLGIIDPDFRALDLADAGFDAGFAVIAALAFVTAEALWGMRRWAYAASRALAASVVGAFLLGVVAGLTKGEFASLIMLPMAAITAWGLQPVLRYVRDRSQALHGTP